MNKFPTIEELFSDTNRLRIIKYFIRNSENFYDKVDIAKRLDMRKNIVERQAKNLAIDNFLKIRKAGKNKQYSLNDKFYLFSEIKNLINKAIPVDDKELILKLRSSGKIQAALVSGVLIGDEDSRADMIIVGKISPSKLNKLIKFIESRTCKELNFVVMSAEEFRYRYKMFDRFVRDSLELPHKKLIFKIRL